jgi:hypothetical protein
LSRRGRNLLWAMIVVGLVGRLVLAFKTYGVRYDIDSFVIVKDALKGDVLHLYSEVNSGPTNRWPYLSGYLPLVVLAEGVANLTGAAFHGVVQMPQIGADLAIAWLVQDFVGRRGGGERSRLIAAALVLFGPAFWITSGYHGQIDQFAILPAVLALWLWERSPPGVRRGAVAGALIGVGAAIKIVPGLMLLALLPSAESARERVTLIAAAVVLPLLSIAPFLVADPDGVVQTFRTHRQLPGLGGLSLVVQPELAQAWLHTDQVSLSGLSRTLHDQQPAFVGVLMAPFAALVLIRRVPPATAAALLFVALLVFGIGFAHQYVVWALPLALMAGYLWQVAAVQAALFPAAAIMYWHPFGERPATLYAAIMIGLWLVLAAALVRWSLRLARPLPGSGPDSPGEADRPDRGEHQ